MELKYSTWPLPEEQRCKLVVRIARQSRIGGLHWTQGFGSGMLGPLKTNRGKAGELSDQEA